MDNSKDPQAGLQPIGKIIKATPVLTREIAVTKRKLKQLECVELVRQARDSSTQEIGYQSRPFVLCGMPIRKPPKDLHEYARRNGKFYLKISSTSPLPYGQDRLIPLWVATLAIRQQNRIVTFNSAAELLREYGLSDGGKHYRRPETPKHPSFAFNLA